MNITTQEQLRKLYKWPEGRAGRKVIFELEKHCKNFISKSPFLVMSTTDREGKMDASPRGGAPGFVHVLNNNTLIIPDSKGNNRVDSLVNIVETGKVGMLFLLPGIEETLRINGSAEISANKDIIDLFPNEKNRPISCIIITVEEAFLHCAKALIRAKLWSVDYVVSKKDFPSMGKMLNDQLGTNNAIETYEEMVARYDPDL
ncbi:MAG: PPOX class probable FMN-dependent enzyme [Saprospiraceae bacterium]|jgi:PPOX class probable FMN-dependent enzyme|tara:strand:+ start:435 stop:1040 length:606 start_codon:yes stop_codon:yes gene_type:complete